MTGAELIARWFVENGMPHGFSERDLQDLAERIDEALAEAREEAAGMRLG